MASTLTDDDRPPSPAGRRPPPNGLLIASGLAMVILAVLTFVAFRSDTDSGPDPTVLDPDATFPGELGAGRDVTGESVTDITYDGFNGASGGSLGALAGRPVVLNFFASWCSPCIEEMPAIEAAYQHYGDQVAFLGINIDGRPEAGVRMVESAGVTYPLGHNRGGAMLERFGAVNMPTTVFIGADGTVKSVHTGKLTQADIERTINETLLT